MQKKLIGFFLSGIILVSAKAQEGSFESWAVGINAGLYGVGVQGATSLNPHLKLRTGFDYISYTHDDAITFEATADHPEGYDVTVEGEISEVSLIFPNFKVLLDYYPVKNSIFSLTGGFYLGANRTKANGLIRNYQELEQQLGEKPEYKYEDIVISPNDDGSFDGKLLMGNSIKPYFGIGLGRTIPKNRVGFRFELGMVYQGKYVLESRNVNEEGQEWIDRMAEEMELPFSQNILKLWPMMNFSLSYRIK
ncbi:MAG: hypothetical protein JJE08_03525 [Proteiniphilum sp.]|nr:hypothetical protein [Proteiniphilum sp.]